MADSIIPLNFRFEKGTNFQTYYASGVIGGLTTRGQVYFSLFLDRQALPESSVLHADTKTGKPVNEDVAPQSENNVREIQAGVLMDITTAQSLHTWLGDKIKEYNQTAIKVEQLNT